MQLVIGGSMSTKEMNYQNCRKFAILELFILKKILAQSKNA